VTASACKAIPMPGGGLPRDGLGNVRLDEPLEVITGGSLPPRLPIAAITSYERGDDPGSTIITV
jgi:hypothetical protein